MNKITFLFIILTTSIFSNINAIVSILPQKELLRAIGGERVDISLMVSPGDSPHHYEPKPSQMLAVAKADLYLAIGVEFEDVWLPKFKSLNPQMQVAHLDTGIEKYAMTQAHHKCSADESHTRQKQEARSEVKKDPHIWTSPANVKSIAQNTYEALVKMDSEHTHYYKANLVTFLASVDETHKQITALLSTSKGSRTFMVFHPSWGYFARDYHLKQIAVEVEGKSPKLKELVKLIKEAKKKKVTAIFTQAEFSDASAKVIAKELNIPVVKISPMSPEWSKNLINMTKIISGQN